MHLKWCFRKPWAHFEFYDKVSKGYNVFNTSVLSVSGQLSFRKKNIINLWTGNGNGKKKKKWILPEVFKLQQN